MKFTKSVRSMGAMGLIGALWFSTGCVNVRQGQNPQAPGAPTLGAAPTAASADPLAPNTPQQNPAGPGNAALTAPVDPNFQPPGAPATAGAAGAPIQTARGPFSFPVAGNSRFSDDFGQGTHAFGGSSVYNVGIDIFADKGTPLVACVAGTVRRDSSEKGGNALFIESAEGTTYYYAHLDSYAPGLADGQRVEAGTPVGAVGNTGNAQGTAPHLHFAAVKNDQPWNPYETLTQAKGASQNPT